MLDYLFGRSFFCNRDDLDTHRHRCLAVLATDMFREVDLFGDVAMFNRNFPYKLTHRLRSATTQKGDRLRPQAVSVLACENAISGRLQPTNVLFKFVPTVPTTVMMATEMPAAIRPYSMAVAPSSFLMNLPISDVMVMCPFQFPSRGRS